MPPPRSNRLLTVQVVLDQITVIWPTVYGAIARNVHICWSIRVACQSPGAPAEVSHTGSDLSESCMYMTATRSVALKTWIQLVWGPPLTASEVPRCSCEPRWKRSNSGASSKCPFVAHPDYHSVDFQYRSSRRLRVSEIRGQVMERSQSIAVMDRAAGR